MNTMNNVPHIMDFQVICPNARCNRADCRVETFDNGEHITIICKKCGRTELVKENKNNGFNTDVKVVNHDVDVDYEFKNKELNWLLK